jgi:hypothetical protein
MDEFVTWSFTYGKNVQMRIPVHVNSQLYANELSLIKLPSFIKLMLRCGKDINNGIEIFIYNDNLINMSASIGCENDMNNGIETFIL